MVFTLRIDLASVFGAPWQKPSYKQTPISKIVYKKNIVINVKNNLLRIILIHFDKLKGDCKTEKKI